MQHRLEREDGDVRVEGGGAHGYAMEQHSTIGKTGSLPSAVCLFVTPSRAQTLSVLDISVRIIYVCI